MSGESKQQVIKRPSVRQTRRAFQCLRLMVQKTLQRRNGLRWVLRYRFLLIGLSLVVLCLTFPGIVSLCPTCFIELDYEKAGQAGDMFGALNTLFSGLAFAGFLLALWMQRQDLNLQRQEMRNSRKEMERQTEKYEEQIIAVNLESHVSAMQRLFEQVGSATHGISLLDNKALSNETSLFVRLLSSNISSQALEKVRDKHGLIDATLKRIAPWAEKAYSWELKIAKSSLSEEKKLEYRMELIRSLNEDERLCLALYYIRHRRLEWDNHNSDSLFDGCPKLLPTLYTFFAVAKNMDRVGIDMKIKALFRAHFLISRTNSINRELAGATDRPAKYLTTINKFIQTADDIYLENNFEWVKTLLTINPQITLHANQKTLI